MRLTSILVVLVIGFSIIATGTSFHPFGGTGTPSFQTLDVCHSMTPVVNPELPYISVCPCEPLPLQAAGVSEPYRMAFNPLIPAVQDERPPKSLT